MPLPSPHRPLPVKCYKPTNQQNKYTRVLSHYFSSVALCFLVTVKRGPWRQDSPIAVHQWKSNIVHKQRSGNQYFITKLLVRMKRNGWGGLFLFFFFWQSSQSRVSGGVQCQKQGDNNGGLRVRGVQAGKLKLRHLSCNGNQNNRKRCIIFWGIAQLAISPR